MEPIPGGPDPKLFPKVAHCIYCEFPIRATAPEHGYAAMHEHAEYVNLTADRTTDPHFEDMRLSALMAR